jgi:hypothetical protein
MLCLTIAQVNNLVSIETKLKILGRSAQASSLTKVKVWRCDAPQISINAKPSFDDAVEERNFALRQKIR